MVLKNIKVKVYWSLIIQCYGSKIIYLKQIKQVIIIKQFLFICVEKEKPYAVCVHEMSEMYLRHAHNRMMETLYTIKHATDNEEYDTGWDEINTIHLPDWMNASGAF